MASPPATIEPMSAEDVLVNEPVTQSADNNQRAMFTTYNVQTPMSNAVSSSSPIRRRYSDFQWLYQRLVTERPGAIVPIIPHKRAILFDTKFSPELIDERQAQLQLFMRRILTESPELADAPSLRPFLTLPLADFERAKSVFDSDSSSSASGEKIQSPRNEEKDTPANQDPNKVNRARKAIGNLFTKAGVLMQVSAGGVDLEETNEDPELNVIREYITDLESHVKTMCTASSALVQSTKDKAAAIQQFGLPIHDWALTRRECLHTTAGDKDPVLIRMFAIHKTCVSISELMDQHELVEKQRFDGAVHDLASQVHSVRVALTKRRDFQITYTARNKQFHDSKNNVVRLQEQNRPYEKALTQKEQAGRDAMAAKHRLEECSKRLLREAGRIQPILERSLEACVKCYAELQIAQSSKIAGQWQALLPKLEHKEDETPAGQQPPTDPPPPVPPSSDPPVPPPSEPPAPVPNGDDKKEEGNEEEGDDEDL